MKSNYMLGVAIIQVIVGLILIYGGSDISGYALLIIANIWALGSLLAD